MSPTGLPDQTADDDTAADQTAGTDDDTAAGAEGAAHGRDSCSGRGSGALSRVNRILGRIAPPAPDPDFADTASKSVRVSVLSATLCLGVSALLVSGKIVEIADRMPLGPQRDRWHAAATGFDRFGSRLGLDRPYDMLRELRGAGDEAGQRIDFIGDVQDLLDLASTPDPFGSSVGQPGPIDPSGSTAGGGVEDRGSADDGIADGIRAGRDDGARTAGTTDGDGAPTGNAGDGDAPGPAGHAADGDDGAEHGSTDAPAGAGDGAPGNGAHPLDRPDAADGAEAPDTPAAVHAPGPARPLPVSAETPLRTYIAGDSQAFHLGHAMRSSPMSDVMDITLDQRHSTGLARPSYFNWPVHMFFVAVGSDPELLVMTMGSNDWQGMSSEDNRNIPRGSEEWQAEWGRRLSVMLDALDAPHRQIVWVGLPPTRADDFREGYALMNRIVAGIAAERDFVTMIDIWEMFGGDAPYRKSVPPPGDPDGAPMDVRNNDGVHLNRRGAEWVVDLIEEEVRRVWDPQTD